MARLNDTRASVDTPLHSCAGDPLRAKSGERGNYPPCPDGGMAITARRNIPGMMQYAYADEAGDAVYGVNRKTADVGSESLKGAMMVLGKRIGGRR